MAAPEFEPILPVIDELNRPFWEGCAAGELRIQACLSCGHLRYPISDVCPKCLAREFEWRPMSGAGEILSWVVFHHAYHPAWTNRVPYNVVLVQLREGPRMFGNVEPISRLDLLVGAPVRVVFVPAIDPADSGPGGPGTVIVPRWELS